MSRFYKEKSLRRNDFFVRNCGRNINCRPRSKMTSNSVTYIKRQSSLNEQARDTMSSCAFTFNCRVFMTVMFQR